MILNMIQIFYLFKETFSKTLNIKFSVAHASHKVPPCLSLFSFLDPTPKGVGHPPSPCPRGAWAFPPCWFLNLGCFIIKERRAREEEKKTIKELIEIQALFRFAG